MPEHLTYNKSKQGGGGGEREGERERRAERARERGREGGGGEGGRGVLNQCAPLCIHTISAALQTRRSLQAQVGGGVMPIKASTSNCI